MQLSGENPKVVSRFIRIFDELTQFDDPKLSRVYLFEAYHRVTSSPPPDFRGNQI